MISEEPKDSAEHILRNTVKEHSKAYKEIIMELTKEIIFESTVDRFFNDDFF